MFFFNDTAPTEIYTLSLHDALPISHADLEGRLPVAAMGDAQHRLVGGIGRGLGVLEGHMGQGRRGKGEESGRERAAETGRCQDRKSTRLNSSHANISYAVFCLKKKK